MRPQVVYYKCPKGESLPQEFKKSLRKTNFLIILTYWIIVFKRLNVFMDVPQMAEMFRRLMPFLSRLISLLYCCLYASSDLR